MRLLDPARAEPGAEDAYDQRMDATESTLSADVEFNVKSPAGLDAAEQERADLADARATRLFMRALIIGAGVLLVWVIIVFAAFQGS